MLFNFKLPSICAVFCDDSVMLSEGEFASLLMAYKMKGAMLHVCVGCQACVYV